MGNEHSSKRVEFAGYFGADSGRERPDGAQNPDTLGGLGYTPRVGPQPVQALYRELDGAIVRRAEANWPLSVYAIHETGIDRWIQLAAPGPGKHDLIVHATAGARSDEIIASVEAWLADPAADTRVIHV